MTRIYVNSDITKAPRSRKVTAFADCQNQAAGSDHEPLVFSSQLTTYKVSGELTGCGFDRLIYHSAAKTR